MLRFPLHDMSSARRALVGAAIALAAPATAAAAPCPPDTVGFDGACRAMPFFQGLIGGGVLYRVDGSAASTGSRVVITRLLPDGAEVLTVDGAPAGPHWTGPVVGPFRVVSRWSHRFLDDAGTVTETVTDGRSGIDGWSEDTITTDWTDADNGVRCDADSCEAVSSPGDGSLDAVQDRMVQATSMHSTGACVDATGGAEEEASISDEGSSQCATTYGILGVDDGLADLFAWLADEECEAGNEVVYLVNHRIMCSGYVIMECTEKRYYETTEDCGLEYVGSTDNCECPGEGPDWT